MSVSTFLAVPGCAASAEVGEVECLGAGYSALPTRCLEFRAELTQINLNQLWMQRFDEKLPQVYASKIKPGRKVIGFLTSANQPPF